MALNINKLLPGHTLSSHDVRQVPGPRTRDSLGRLTDLWWLTVGVARCSCGTTSEELGSVDEREQWHRDHKDQIRTQIRETPINAPAPFPYMTSIPDRVPAQKPHASLGQAKKAVLFRLGINPFTHEEELTVDCNVYEWTSDGWKTLWNIKAGTDRKAMPWLLPASPKN